MDNQYTAQLLRRGRLLAKSHNFENKSENFNILYIYQPNIYLLIILKIFIFKKKCFIVFIKYYFSYEFQPTSRKKRCV